MTVSNTTKRELSPTHPGEMLREDFMPDFDLNAFSGILPNSG
jgi:plasmid maintenance system antidote protein VapI